MNINEIYEPNEKLKLYFVYNSLAPTSEPVLLINGEYVVKRLLNLRLSTYSVCRADIEEEHAIPVSILKYHPNVFNMFHESLENVGFVVEPEHLESFRTMIYAYIKYKHKQRIKQLITTLNEAKSKYSAFSKTEPSDLFKWPS